MDARQAISVIGFVMTGNFRAPWDITLNPFIIVQSGRPFNIILGRDLNNDTINNERPAFAPAGADCSNTTLFKCTPYGNFKWLRAGRRHDSAQLRGGTRFD